jgi:hypothetical protein
MAATENLVIKPTSRNHYTEFMGFKKEKNGKYGVYKVKIRTFGV